MFMKLLIDSKAATAIEYGLIASLIAVAAITALRATGSKVSTTFNKVTTNMQ